MRKSKPDETLIIVVIVAIAICGLVLCSGCATLDKIMGVDDPTTTQPTTEQQANEELSNAIAGVLGGLLPGAGLAWLVTRRAYRIWRKAAAQTAEAIHETYPDGLPPTLKSSLHKNQDRDVKEVIGGIVAELPKPPTPLPSK